MKAKIKLLIKGSVLLFLSTMLFLSFPLPGNAIENIQIPPLPDISGARSVCLYNYESDKMIAFKSTGGKIAPASIVKIVTGLVALDNLSTQMEESIIIVPEMVDNVEGTNMGLRIGMTVKIRDLFYGAICGGYNDAANALAICSLGNIESFVQKMNEFVISLGCTNTFLTNPTGLDDNNMYTTLSDVILISKCALKSTEYVSISSAPSYLFQPSGSENMGKTIHNRNALISSYYHQGYQNRYAEGLIAGMTENGGYCVVTSAQYENAHYLCIVMGASGNETVIQSFRIADRLLKYAIQNFSVIEFASSGHEVCKIPVRLAMPSGKEDVAMLPCILPDAMSGLVPDIADPAKDLIYKFYLYEEEMTAPVDKGEVVGGVDIYCAGELLGHSRLVAGKQIEANSILKGMESLKHFFFSRSMLISFISFILISFGWFGLWKPWRRKKEKRFYLN